MACQIQSSDFERGKNQYSITRFAISATCRLLTTIAYSYIQQNHWLARWTTCTVISLRRYIPAPIISANEMQDNRTTDQALLEPEHSVVSPLSPRHGSICLYDCGASGKPNYSGLGSYFKADCMASRLSCQVSVYRDVLQASDCQFRVDGHTRMTVIGVSGDDRPRLVALWDALLQTRPEAFVLSSIYYQVKFHPSAPFMVLNSTTLVQVRYTRIQAIKKPPEAA